MEHMIGDLVAQQKSSRRNFLKASAAATLAFTLPDTNWIAKDMRMGIVVHSYATRWNAKVSSQQYPGFTNAIDLLKHIHTIGASGIQVVIKDWTTEFAKKLKLQKEQLGLYVEGSMGIPFKSDDIPAFEKDLAAAKEAGINIIRTVCTTGRRYEVYHSRADFDQAHSNALNALRLVEPVLKKHKMKLAVENHKDWRASELADMIKQLSSEWIGVTLDFGNSIALMEDPLEVVKTLAPYHFTTHVKDMGIDEYANGLLLSEVPLGTGILDLTQIVSICRQHNPNSNFNLEMITRDPLEIPCLTDDYWQTFTAVPGNDLARTLRMTRSHKAKDGLPKVSQLTAEERLAVEEKNILECLTYSAGKLGMK